MSEVHESVINSKIAEILSKELEIDARAERPTKKKTIDIKCYYNGIIIGIESSYSRSDAEKDAKKRIEQGLVDIAIALWIKEKFKDVPELELVNAVKKAKYDVRVFVSRDIEGTLIPYLEKSVKKAANPTTRWFIDADLPTIRNLIDYSVDFMIKEEDVKSIIEEMKVKIDNFTKSLAEIDKRGVIRDEIYNVLYKLYGLSIAEARDSEIVYGHAGLSILLSTVLYEHVRSTHPQLKPIKTYIRMHGKINGLRYMLQDLLQVDYKAAVKATLDIIDVLPLAIDLRVSELIDLALKIASNKSLLRRDFAGRIYHEITGDMVLRKGFATFYTEIPAAYLLASLAVDTLLGLDSKNILELGDKDAFEVIKKINSIKVGDFACGSGTLLTASYYAFQRQAIALNYYHDLNITLENIEKELIESGIYGIDALRYASQITAINLALIAPSTISKENIYTIYLGYIPDKKMAWLGSLELLNNTGMVGGLLAWIEGGLNGIAEKVTLEGQEGVFSIPEKFDLIIMNPPFTRATGRTEKFGEELTGKRGLFGFIGDEVARKKLHDEYKKLRDCVREDLFKIAQMLGVPKDIPKDFFNIGQAGEGLLFLYLAYKYVKKGGVIAFVLPRNVLAGVSWFLARTLLVSKFHVKYVIVSSDAKNGYNFSEGTSLSETLIIAERKDEHRDDDETIFINLLQKPKTALEALILAENIKRGIRNGNPYVARKDSLALLVRAKRDDLTKNIENWNRLIAFSGHELNDIAKNVLNGNIFGVKVPLKRLGEIVDVVGLAVRRGKFHEVFQQVPSKAPEAIPALIGSEEKLREKILVEPNAWVVAKNKRYLDTASKFLVPDRLWIETTHTTALMSKKELVSNMFFGLKPKNESLTEDHLKVLILWFNTTWGILAILSERTETRGGWIELTITKWKILPVLDVTALDEQTISYMVRILDHYADMKMRRLLEQFDHEKPDFVRLNIDLGFLLALIPKSEKEDEEKKMRESIKTLKLKLKLLYEYMERALKAWIER